MWKRGEGLILNHVIERKRVVIDALTYRDLSEEHIKEVRNEVKQHVASEWCSEALGKNMCIYIVIYRERAVLVDWHVDGKAWWFTRIEFYRADNLREMWSFLSTIARKAAERIDEYIDELLRDLEKGYVELSNVENEVGKALMDRQSLSNFMSRALFESYVGLGEWGKIK